MKSRISYILLFVVCFFSAQGENEDQFSADAYYNQGNAAYNNGEFGEAVYQYEKALLLDPFASDILLNLDLAKERLDADIVELDPFFLAEWWQALTDLFLPGIWKILSLLFFFAFLFLLFHYFFKNKFESKMIYSVGSFLLFAAFLSSLAGRSRSLDIFENKYAIVSVESDALLEGPDPVSEEIKNVVNGIKVKILDSNSDWHKVATMDSEQGWIEKNKVRYVKFEKR